MIDHVALRVLVKTWVTLIRCFFLRLKRGLSTERPAKYLNRECKVAPSATKQTLMITSTLRRVSPFGGTLLGSNQAPNGIGEHQVRTVVRPSAMMSKTQYSKRVDSPLAAVTVVVGSIRPGSARASSDTWNDGITSKPASTTTANVGQSRLKSIRYTCRNRASREPGTRFRGRGATHAGERSLVY